MTTDTPLLSRRLSAWVRRRHRRLAVILLVLVLWFLGHLAVICWVGLHDDLRPCDVAVVLGNGITAAGEPGTTLQARLDKAVELYRAKRFAHVIVSGAVGDGGYDEPGAMRRYLVRQGLPAQAVIEDPDGSNTYFTALNTRRIMRERHWRTVLAISHYYHLLRTRRTFARMGMVDVRAAHARLEITWYEPYVLAREFVAYYAYLCYPYPRSRAD